MVKFLNRAVVAAAALLFVGSFATANAVPAGSSMNDNSTITPGTVTNEETQSGTTNGAMDTSAMSSDSDTGTVSGTTTSTTHTKKTKKKTKSKKAAPADSEMNTGAGATGSSTGAPGSGTGAEGGTATGAGGM